MPGPKRMRLVGTRWLRRQAFGELKRAMVTLPVLTLRNFAIPFTLETDASGTGLGAVLSQNGRPIAYFNQTLSERARGKSVYERELMAVVLAIQKWRHYLLGHRFTVCTFYSMHWSTIPQVLVGTKGSSNAASKVLDQTPGIWFWHPIYTEPD